jgi:hypothetical protein
MKVYILLIAVVLLGLAGCSRPTEPEYPDWLDAIIKRYQREPVGNPPQSIWRYEYKGQVVYYVPAQCCDQFSTLYDAKGKIICSPDGGFSGRGDGHCTDFFSTRANEKLIWKDSRSRAGDGGQAISRPLGRSGYQ